MIFLPKWEKNWRVTGSLLYLVIMSKTNIFLNSLLYNEMVVTGTVDVINQSETKNRVKKQISEKSFHDVSDFEFKFSLSDFGSWLLERVGFSIRFFTTRWILKQVFFEVVVFILRKFQSFSSWKKVLWKKSRFDSFYHVKLTKFALCVLFWKIRFWNKNFTTYQVLSWKLFKLWEFK